MPLLTRYVCVDARMAHLKHMEVSFGGVPTQNGQRQPVLKLLSNPDDQITNIATTTLNFVVFHCLNTHRFHRLARC